MSKAVPILIIFLSLILSACSKGEAARSGERSQTPDAVGSGTPPDVNGGDQTTHLIKGGGKLCEAYLLKKVSEDKAEGNQVLKLKAFDRNDERLPNDVKKWLEIANEEAFSAHELQYGDKRALLLNATHIHASGLATNFQYWFIRLDDQHIEFLSQSENPDLIFWNRDGLLNYWAIDFSDKFLMDKDWNNVTLNLLRYRVSPDGTSQLVSEERNVKCE